MVKDLNIAFKVPQFIDSDINCPAVTGYELFNKDCNTLSSAFENAGDLGPTLSNRFLYGKLVNKTALKTYQFCLKVTTFSSNFKMVPNLELLVYAPSVIASCNNSLSKVSESFHSI